MKKYCIIILLALFFSGCSEDVWLDHNDPRVYIPKYGFSLNKAWILESNEYTIDMSVYCSGVRPENQKNDITVTYSVSPELITAYNNDISQEYSGQIVELPTECYSFTDTKVVIPKGKSHGEVPIKIDLAKMKALGLSLNEVKYAIPVRLQSTSMYNLQEDSEMLEAIYCITIDEPSFYFWDNRETDRNTVSKNVMYDDEDHTDEYRIAAYGLGQVVGEDYTVTLAVDEDAVPSDGELLPSDAYEFPTTVTFEKGKSETFVPVKIINNKVAFRKTFYLPITITSVSKYKANEKKKTLLLKVTIKNDYEWNYSSKMAVEWNGRSDNRTEIKSTKSYEHDILIMDILTDYYDIADNYDYQQRYYIYYSLGVKIIPTQDKRHYNVELIHTNPSMTGKNWYGYQSPKTLEQDPEKESYYDWDYETFHLNYRYRKYDDPKEDWVYITEILEAQ